MKLRINRKDIWKQKIFIIVKNNKIIYKTYNQNKIKSYIKTMNYLKMKDYQCYMIFIDKIRKEERNDKYNNIN